jgi:hypothetical protein
VNGLVRDPLHNPQIGYRFRTAVDVPSMFSRHGPDGSGVTWWVTSGSRAFPAHPRSRGARIAFRRSRQIDRPNRSPTAARRLRDCTERDVQTPAHGGQTVYPSSRRACRSAQIARAPTISDEKSTAKCIEPRASENARPHDHRRSRRTRIADIRVTVSRTMRYAEQQIGSSR